MRSLGLSFTNTKFAIAIKSLFQLGLEPLALNLLYKFGLWTGHYERKSKLDPRCNNIELSTFTPLFSFPPRSELLKFIRSEDKIALLREADDITAGRVRLFSGVPVPLQLSFNEPLQHWTDYETGKVPLPFSQPDQTQFTDIKFLWEPGRFGWAFILGRAYFVSGKEEYAEAFWKYFECFSDGNPAYLGPHWMNGQEVAIRLMAFVWAAQIFEGAAASSFDQRTRLIQSIAIHAARIPLTFAYARSQGNNHLLIEAAALFTAGTALNINKWSQSG